jgi:hypothetical protein
MTKIEKVEVSVVRDVLQRFPDMYSVVATYDDGCEVGDRVAFNPVDAALVHHLDYLYREAGDAN